MSGPFEATVAEATHIGGRDENQDRSSTALSADGSWVIAVADGLGGHDRGAEAAAAAITGFPRRIESLAELKAAFAGANRRVAALAPEPRTRRPLPTIPMSTLCVAAWTPQGGLLVAQTGDTLAVLFSRPPGDYPAAAFITKPHRGTWGEISACLGLPTMDLGRDGLWERHRLDGDSNHTIILASDGAWEPLARLPTSRERQMDHDMLEHYLVPLIDAAAAADEAASAILEAAENIGLDDNATLAAAHMRPTGNE